MPKPKKYPKIPKELNKILGLTRPEIKCPKCQEVGLLGVLNTKKHVYLVVRHPEAQKTHMVPADMVPQALEAIREDLERLKKAIEDAIALVVQYKEGKIQEDQEAVYEDQEYAEAEDYDNAEDYE